MATSNSFADARANADAYVKRMIEIVGDRDPVVVMEASLESLRIAVASFPAGKEAVAEAPGKWSLLDVVKHLADTEIVYGYRVRMILSHDTPDIEGFDQDRWASNVRYDGATVADFLDMAVTVRAMNLRIYRALTPSDLERYGVHSERGKESIWRTLRMCAAHDEVHLSQIARIAAAVGVA
ncbi:MAG: DinB family protein [Thermoanaerobaculia bacterium]